jgi:hypothetical protein
MEDVPDKVYPLRDRTMVIAPNYYLSSKFNFFRLSDTGQTGDIRLEERTVVEPVKIVSIFNVIHCEVPFQDNFSSSLRQVLFLPPFIDLSTVLHPPPHLSLATRCGQSLGVWPLAPITATSSILF